MQIFKRLPVWYKFLFLAFFMSAIFSIYYFKNSGPRHDAGLWPFMFSGFPWIILGILPLEMAVGLNLLILLAIGYAVLKK